MSVRVGLKNPPLRSPTDWHHEACRVMTNGDHEGQIFLSHPHTYDRSLYSCTPLNMAFLYLYIGCSGPVVGLLFATY